MHARHFCVIGLLLMTLLAGCGGSTAGTKATSTSTTVPASTSVPHQPVAYFGTGKTLFALDPATGAQRWKYAVTDPVVNGGIHRVWVVDDTVFFAIGNTSWLYAVSASNGALRWKVHEGANSADPFAPIEQLVVAAGIVYTASTASQVPSGTFAINLASGQVIWRKDGPASLVTDGSRVYLIETPPPQGDTPTNGTIRALKASDASMQWQAGGYPFGQAIIDDGALYVTAGKSLVALNAQTGATLWTKSVDGALRWLDQGAHVLFLTDGVAVYALDPTSQKFLWRNPFAEHSFILYRNGNLLVPAYRQIYGVNAANGAQVWSQSGFASAISTNDTAAFMLIGDPSAGILYAISTATGKALWTSKTLPVAVPTYATETSVYALSGVGATQPVTVQALSAATGALQWQFDPHSEYSSGSLVVG